MPKILSAHDAVRQYIHDGDTVTFGGFASGLMHPESILRALEERARNGEGPHGLTALYAAGQGDSDSRGLNHLGVEGLCRRVIGGHWGLSPKLGRLCAENKLAGYNLPQGVIAQLFRDIAAGKPGVITHVGLGTFVDPRLEGGKLNDAARAAGDVVKLIELEGEEKLFYPAIPIQVAILRASYADTRGNCTFQREGVYAEALAQAQAAGIPAERSSSRWSALWNTAPWTPAWCACPASTWTCWWRPRRRNICRPSAPVITRPSPARCASLCAPCPRCPWESGKSSPAGPPWSCSPTQSPTWASACRRGWPPWRRRRAWRGLC